MTTEDAVELAPDAQDDDGRDDDVGRVARARQYASEQVGRLPRPSPPPAQDAIYAYTVGLLFLSPAVAVAGATWVAQVYASTPVAVAVGGLSSTVYALFLTLLVVRYEQATTVEESE